MKQTSLLLIIVTNLVFQVYGQDNNILKGKVLFLSSKNTPAVGVRVSGSIASIEKSNSVYTKDKGDFMLKFPEARIGYKVDLEIGYDDRNGTVLEIVNLKEVQQLRIPADPTNSFEIIVCKKEERDLAAQKYYKILKTSADKALNEKRKALDSLLVQKQKNYELIASLSERISKLEQQTDSISIYREAYRIASINKDKASDRVLKYIELLDQGKSIQEAREELSKELAAKDLGKSIEDFESGIRELDTLATSAKTLHEYKDAITHYDSIIFSLEDLEAHPLKIAMWYQKAAIVGYHLNDYEKAIYYQQKVIDYKQEIYSLEPTEYLVPYSYMVLIHHKIGNYSKTVRFQEEIITILDTIPSEANPIPNQVYQDLLSICSTRGESEFRNENYSEALSNFRLINQHEETATNWNKIGVCYYHLKKYQQAIEAYQDAVRINPNFKNIHFYQNIGITYTYNNQFTNAEEIFNECEERYSQKGETYLNWTAYYALRVNHKKAITNLKKAIKLGYDNKTWQKTIVHLDNIKESKKYKALIKQLQNNQK